MNKVIKQIILAIVAVAVLGVVANTYISTTSESRRINQDTQKVKEALENIR